MKVKTNSLTGAALDWAVSLCEETEQPKEKDQRIKYSTDWLWGGPIIEKEGLWPRKYDTNLWTARLESEEYWTAGIDGPTPLIAAMRCYVSSKLGDEVEIPEELLP